MKTKETKYFQATTVKKSSGKLLAVASTSTVDRVGDSLSIEDWDLSKFKANPVLQAGHDYRPQYTIGIAQNIRVDEKGRLVFEPLFHEETQLARDIKAMYECEPPILKAWSVGFIPNAMVTNRKGEKMGKNELLEVSAVAVPANAEALTYSKSYGEKESEMVSGWLKKALPLGDDTLIDVEDGQETDVSANTPTPDSELVEGESCITSDGVIGSVILDGDVLVCKIVEKVEMMEGDVCKLPDGTDGCLVMHDESGKFICMPVEPDEGNDMIDENPAPIEEEVIEPVVEDTKGCGGKGGGKKKELDENGSEVTISETITEAISEQQKNEMKWEKMKKVDQILYAFYKVYMEEETPVEDFNKLLDEAVSLLTSLSTDYTKGFESSVFKSEDFNGDLMSIMEISIKEGRVLSSKNVGLITECINILKQASIALDSLLSVSVPDNGSVDSQKSQDEKAKEIEDIKGREKVKVLANLPAQIDADKVILKALQRISRLSSKAIYDKKNN